MIKFTGHGESLEVGSISSSGLSRDARPNRKGSNILARPLLLVLHFTTWHIQIMQIIQKPFYMHIIQIIQNHAACIYGSYNYVILNEAQHAPSTGCVCRLQ